MTIATSVNVGADVCLWAVLNAAVRQISVRCSMCEWKSLRIHMPAGSLRDHVAHKHFPRPINAYGIPEPWAWGQASMPSPYRDRLGILSVVAAQCALAAPGDERVAWVSVMTDRLLESTAAEIGQVVTRRGPVVKGTGGLPSSLDIDYVLDGKVVHTIPTPVFVRDARGRRRVVSGTLVPPASWSTDPRIAVDTETRGSAPVSAPASVEAAEVEVNRFSLIEIDDEAQS